MPCCPDTCSAGTQHHLQLSMHKFCNTDNNTECSCRAARELQIGLQNEPCPSVLDPGSRWARRQDVHNGHGMA